MIADMIKETRMAPLGSVWIGRIVLICAVVGGKSVAASFDCGKDGLSRIENIICTNIELSALDSQLASIYAVARATVEEKSKGALLQSQKTWLATRNLCSGDQCVHAAYDARIAELSSAPYVRGIDFDLKLKMGPHGPEPQCGEIPLTFFGSIHVEPKEIPQAFAGFIPFVQNGSKVLDLRCAAIKGNGSKTYFLVTRKPNGFPGVLILLSRAPDGSLRREAENESIIQSDVAGMSGGYEGIAISKHGFTVQNSFGSGAGGSSFGFTFTYSTRDQTWMLEKIDIESYGNSDAQTAPAQHLTTKTLGRVKFADFDAAPYPIARP